MYMRLVQVNVNPERMPENHRMYEEEVLPRLEHVPGCLFASMIESEQRPGECISLTLWSSRAHAEQYARSGVFQELLKKAAPLMADTSEWRMHLSEDLTLQYEPVPSEPVINAYEVTASETEGAPSRTQSSCLFVRIVSPQIRPDKMEEFKNIYVNEILPALRRVKGCRYAYLTENVQNKNQVISVTIWDSKHDAEAYEQGGTFEAMKEKIERTLADVYQWKMRLEKDSGGQVVTSEEMSVGGYRVVSCKSFH